MLVTSYQSTARNTAKEGDFIYNARKPKITQIGYLVRTGLRFKEYNFLDLI